MRITIPTHNTGETVARAKSTARAEARRRYRAAEDDGADFDGSEDTPSTPGAPRTAARVGTGSATPGRVGMRAAFTQAIRPLHVREDLAALPWIAIHSKALWLPLLITVASAVAAITVGGTNVISAFLFAYFVQTPAIGGVFIAGFLAPRASWLLGVIIGFVAAVGYSIYIVIAAGRVTDAGGPPPAVIQETILSALILSPILGGFFASGAAWYRRFLALSSPNRGRQSQAAKQAAKRGDGRTRGSQKAGARR